MGPAECKECNGVEGGVQMRVTSVCNGCNRVSQVKSSQKNFNLSSQGNSTYIRLISLKTFLRNAQTIAIKKIINELYCV